MSQSLSSHSSTRWRTWVTVWLALGALLRAILIAFPRSPDDDTDAYLELGRNLLHRGTYGFLDDNVVSPALFRLPGYPIFLALLGGHMGLIFLVQSALALFAAYLLALFLRRSVSERAGLAALALTSLCFFTAEYDAAALTESLSVFAVAAAIYTLGRYLASPHAFTWTRWLTMLAPIAACASLAMMLRPDGAILTISLAVALCVYGIRRAGLTAALRTTLLFGLLAAVPLVPWAIRNAVTFHVFQPLAPRHVNDPGERVNLGFYRWLRTWSVEFQTTYQVFWRVGTERIDLRDIPPRAFDSPAQRDQTTALISAYNAKHDVDQPLDDRFAALAATRIHDAPLRYFVWIPALRIADMFLRPRTEGLDIATDWWVWPDHPMQSALALLLALINLAYILLALAGSRRRPPLAVFFATYLVIRCILLGTMENSEPRYSLETFPILITLAALCFEKAQKDNPIPSAPPDRSSS